MPSPTYAVFRNAILTEQQVTCTYQGRRRVLCPHIIGLNKDFESEQTCITRIDLDINIHVRKRR